MDTLRSVQVNKITIVLSFICVHHFQPYIPAGDKPDGCATFFKRSKYSLCQALDLEFDTMAVTSPGQTSRYNIAFAFRRVLHSL